MCKIMLLLFYFCLDIFSYDKIEVSSYLEEPSFSSVKYIYPKDDKVYILLANSLKVYSSTFSYIGTIGLKSENSTAFAISEDSLYVLDFKKCSIDVYDLLGNIVFSFGSCGKYYGQMSSPQDIRVFDNKIFVADEGGYINVYSKDGIFLYSFSTFSKDGTKRYFPVRLSFDPEGFIYIVDKKNQVIAKYDLNGKCHFEYFTKEFPLDITESGFIYTGSLEGKIREYDLLFRQKGIFGTKGKNRYEFQSFSDIKAYKDGIFVADSKNKKLLYLKIYNRNVGVYERKIINKDYIWVKPYKTFKLNSAVFNVLDNETIYFFNNFKNNEGIYKYSNNNLSKIISYGKGNILGVSDIIEHNGKLYILDNVEKKVKVYEDEKYLFSFGDKVGFLGGSKEGKFSQPVKMVFDALEKIYILDTKLYMIQVFNKDGIFLYYIDLSSYKAFNFYDILLDEENNLYVLSDNKIFVFNSDGKYIREFDLKDVNSAVSFCYDGINYIFILDRNKSRVYVYDRKGRYISSFFCKGFRVTELKDPILIRFKNNKIYILDSSDRILSFDVFYHVYSSLFDVIYDSKSVSANFDFEIDNKEYLKNLVIEKSTDNKFLNVSTLSSIQSDKALIIDSTYYYRLRLISVTNQVSFSDIKSVFVFKDITKKGEQTEQINRPPIEIIPINLDYIFASSYKYYLSNPIGKILIKNNTANNFENLKLSFSIRDYMDFPFDIVIDSLPSRSQREVNINATLNSKILAITETTPIQAKLILEYYLNDERRETSLSIPLRILSRNSIVWDDVRRISSFITLKDPLISDLSRVIASKKDEIKGNVDSNLKIFSLIYNYLSTLGIKYIEDPITPYKISRTSYSVIDMVQYPRNILKIKAGDCDDLTVIFTSLLEACGVETIIFDFGDHITAGFKLESNNIDEIGIPQDLIVEYKEKYYVPFEVTMLGKDIYSNISYSANNYKIKKENVKIYVVRDILNIYEPPTFSDDYSYDISVDSNIILKSQSDIDFMERKYFEYYEKYYKSILAEEPKNIDALIRLSIIYGFQEKYEEAQKILEEILKEDSNNAAALNNLGNLYYLKKDYSRAKQYYEMAYKADPYDANILINAAKNLIKSGEKENAKILLENAFRMNPELKKMEKELMKEE